MSPLGTIIGPIGVQPALAPPDLGENPTKGFTERVEATGPRQMSEPERRPLVEGRIGNRHAVDHRQTVGVASGLPPMRSTCRSAFSPDLLEEVPVGGLGVGPAAPDQ